MVERLNTELGWLIVLHIICVIPCTSKGLGEAAQPLILQATGHGWLANETPNAPCAVHFLLVSVSQIPFPAGIALSLAPQFLLLCLNVKCPLGPNAYGCVTTHQKLPGGKLC